MNVLEERIKLRKLKRLKRIKTLSYRIAKVDVYKTYTERSTAKSCLMASQNELETIHSEERNNQVFRFSMGEHVYQLSSRSVSSLEGKLTLNKKRYISITEQYKDKSNQLYKSKIALDHIESSLRLLTMEITAKRQQQDFLNG